MSFHWLANVVGAIGLVVVLSTCAPSGPVAESRAIHAGPSTGQKHYALNCEPSVGIQPAVLRSDDPTDIDTGLSSLPGVRWRMLASALKTVNGEMIAAGSLVDESPAPVVDGRFVRAGGDGRPLTRPPRIMIRQWDCHLAALDDAVLRRKCQDYGLCTPGRTVAAEPGSRTNDGAGGTRYTLLCRSGYRGATIFHAPNTDAFDEDVSKEIGYGWTLAVHSLTPAGAVQFAGGRLIDETGRARNPVGRPLYIMTHQWGCDLFHGGKIP